MPRAPALKPGDEREVRLSAKYLAKTLGEALNQPLELAPDGGTIFNSKSNKTYNTCLLAPADPQTGMSVITMDERGGPVFGIDTAAWLITHEPARNYYWLIPLAQFKDRVRQAVASPGNFAGMIHVEQANQRIYVFVNLKWATDTGVIKYHGQLKPGAFLGFRAEQLAEKEDFVHLHCHSEYSLLDGVSSVQDIARAARLNGQPGIALTDHGNVFGTYKHWAACKEQGVAPLMGVELYMVDDVREHYKGVDGADRRFEYHQTVIAMNQTGWENLAHLLSVAGRDHYYYVPRVDHNMLWKHSEGLIVLSGCFKGMAAHYLQTRQPREGESGLPVWLQRDPDKTRSYLQKYKACFGNRFYGEVQNIDFSQYMAVVPELLQIFDDLGIKKVITGDCHYPRGEDAPVQAVLSRISKQRVDELGATEQPKGIYYIRSMAEMQAPWTTPDMFANTCEVLSRCNLSFEQKGYLFPLYAHEQDVDWKSYSEWKRTANSPATPPAGPVAAPAPQAAMTPRQQSEALLKLLSAHKYVRHTTAANITPDHVARVSELRTSGYNVEIAILNSEQVYTLKPGKPGPYYTPENVTTGLARATDPDTSQEAAQAVMPVLNQLHTWVTTCVKTMPGATSKELAAKFSSDDERRLGRRLNECEQLKLVQHGAERVCTVTGHKAATWWPVGVANV